MKNQSIPSQWRNVLHLAKGVANSQDLVYCQIQAKVIVAMAEKEIERTSNVCLENKETKGPSPQFANLRFKHLPMVKRYAKG